MPRKLLFTALLLSLCACRQDPPAPIEPPPKPPITPVFLDAPTPGPLDRPDASTSHAGHSKPQKEDLEKDRTRILELLDTGRAHVKAGDYPAGITSYDEALRIDPNHARLLSELGWAAFKAGDLALAEQATERSVRHATSPAVKGASLYNLGRIAEARSNPELALVHYADSLQARPDNRTVQKRLDALVAQGVTHAEKPACSFEPKASTPAPTLSAFELCQHFTAHAENLCTEQQPSTPALEVGPYTLRVFTTEPQAVDPGSRYFHVAVIGPESWHVSLVGYEYNPGMGYIHDELDIKKMRARAILPDSELPQVLFTFARHYTDGDYPRNEAVFIDMQLEALLDLNTATPRWLATALVSREESLDYMLDDAHDGIDHGEDFPRSTSSRYKVEWGEDSYTTSLLEGVEIGDLESGTHPYTTPAVRCPQRVGFLY